MSNIVSVFSRWNYIFFVISPILLFTACLEVRDVEPPSAAGGSDWVSPTDYQILLDNLRTSLNQQNVQNYLRCFNREELAFEPVASFLALNESLWSNWSVDDEQTYLNNLFANIAGPTGGILFLEELDLRDVSSDSLRYVGSYRYQVRHGDTTITDVFRGQVQWVMKVNQFNEWEIFRWIDIEDCQRFQLDITKVYLYSVMRKISCIWIFISFSLATLTVISIGCNPFAPDYDPEGLADQSLSLNPTSIEGYFATFKNAYELRDTVLYGRLFTQDFEFAYFDFEIGQEISWDRATEMNIAYNLFQSVQQINLDWNFFTQLDTTEVEAFVVRNFNLTIVQDEQNVFVGAGRARFRLRRNNIGDPWLAYFWFDDSDF